MKTAAIWSGVLAARQACVVCLFGHPCHPALRCALDIPSWQRLLKNRY
jgi:hypothetical protein